MADLSLVPIQIIRDEDDGVDDMGSDEEDYIMENGGITGEQAFGLGDSFVNASNREGGGGIFIHRRRNTGMLKFLPYRFLLKIFVIQRTTMFRSLGVPGITQSLLLKQPHILFYSTHHLRHINVLRPLKREALVNHV